MEENIGHSACRVPTTSTTLYMCVSVLIADDTAQLSSSLKAGEETRRN